MNEQRTDPICDGTTNNANAALVFCFWETVKQSCVNRKQIWHCAQLVRLLPTGARMAEILVEGEYQVEKFSRYQNRLSTKELLKFLRTQGFFSLISEQESQIYWHRVRATSNKLSNSTETESTKQIRASCEGSKRKTPHIVTRFSSVVYHPAIISIPCWTWIMNYWSCFFRHWSFCGSTEPKVSCSWTHSCKNNQAR